MACINNKPRTSGPMGLRAAGQAPPRQRSILTLACWEVELLASLSGWKAGLIISYLSGKAGLLASVSAPLEPYQPRSGPGTQKHWSWAVPGTPQLRHKCTSAPSPSSHSAASPVYRRSSRRRTPLPPPYRCDFSWPLRPQMSVVSPHLITMHLSVVPYDRQGLHPCGTCGTIVPPMFRCSGHRCATLH